MSTYFEVPQTGLRVAQMKTTVVSSAVAELKSSHKKLLYVYTTAVATGERTVKAFLLPLANLFFCFNDHARDHLHRLEVPP